MTSRSYRVKLTPGLIQIITEWDTTSYDRSHRYNLVVARNGAVWLQPVANQISLTTVIQGIINPHRLDVVISGSRNAPWNIRTDTVITVSGVRHGYPELHNKTMQQCRFIETHNSHTRSYDKVFGNIIYQNTLARLNVANQFLSIVSQADLGARSFKLPVRFENNFLYCSHGPRSLDENDIAFDAVANIFNRLLNSTQFSNEVFVIKLDNQSGQYSGAIANELRRCLQVVSRFIMNYDQYLNYNIGRLVREGKRLLIISDINTEFSIHPYSILLPTRYEYPTVSQFINEDVSQYTLQGYWNGKNGNPAGSLFLMNHSVTAPLQAGGSWSLSNQMGSANNIMTRINRLDAQAVRQNASKGIVNFISLDFYPAPNLEPLFTVEKLNGIFPPN
jgi:hypothetical protein